MSQNNNSIIYAGLDIHKATLQLHLAGRDYELANTSAGHRKLVTLIARHEGVQVVCEASGGYERVLVSALHHASVPVSVLNPAQARHFARALGQRAKTDPLDARLLSAYGKAFSPEPTPPKTSAERQLVELVRYRLQLIEKITAERQQSAMLEHPALRRQSQALVRRMESDLAKIDAHLARTTRQYRRAAAESQVHDCRLRRRRSNRSCIAGRNARTGHPEPPSNRSLGRLGSSSSTKRPVDRQILHWRRQNSSASRPLYRCSKRQPD